MKKVLSYEWFNVSIITRLYLIALAIFTSFRILLFLSEYGSIGQGVKMVDILTAFLIGIRFDLVISGYILILPFIVLSILHVLNSRNSFFFRLVFYYTLVLFVLAFLVCAADIPFFNQFFTRFSVIAFTWLNSPGFVAKMILQEPSYWLYMIPWLLSMIFVYKSMKILWEKAYQSPVYRGNWILKLLVSILMLGFIFAGIRGRLEKKSPIKVGTAYFSNNAFLNQLGLNPNFTFIRSYLDHLQERNQPIDLMKNEIALSNVQKYLGIGSRDSLFPLARNISYNDPALKKNVVIVIMESMSANKMKRHGNSSDLTPFLDSISHDGYYFENAYTAGIHTFNGIFSTLFSFPAIFEQHPMNESSMVKYNGLASTLKRHGYSTIYFTTHDGQFDNVEGFLRSNDFDQIISKPSYPSEMVKTTLGVPDDYMFDFSIPILSQLSLQKNPFLAVFMTASDHGPYYIPDYFKPKTNEIRKQIIEYADWSLGKLINLSSKEDWYKNTLFVFIADHGESLDATYEMPLSYYHTPMIFYNPAIIDFPRSFSCMAGQIDLFPTLMGILKQPYLNNTLGIDLINQERPYIYFNGDDKYGVMDQEWFLIVRKDKSKQLFRYRTSDKHDYVNEFPAIATKMQNYAESNLQAFQYLLMTGKQFKQP
jgi:phosphoglycerol transferase MdoB-like AlkP superfamily enzyme